MNTRMTMSERFVTSVDPPTSEQREAAREVLGRMKFPLFDPPPERPKTTMTYESVCRDMRTAYDRISPLTDAELGRAGPSLVGRMMIVCPDPEPKLTQVRFPRSKRRRIWKKWAKRDENFEWATAENTIKDGVVLSVCGVAYVNPRTYHDLQARGI